MESPIFQFKKGTELVVESPTISEDDFLSIRPQDVKQYFVSADGVYEMDVDVFNAYFQLAGLGDIT